MTKNKNTNIINRFIKYFDKEIANISESSNVLHKKLLYSCILDTLATARNPKKQNKKQYISFLRGCSQWDIFDQVSMPQLMLAIKHAQSFNPAFCKNLLKTYQPKIAKSKCKKLYNSC